jgi:hypothetical protein
MVGTVITVTVGDGGAGYINEWYSRSNGSNSSISGSGLTTITSAGGGGGGGINPSKPPTWLDWFKWRFRWWWGMDQF